LPVFPMKSPQVDPKTTMTARFESPYFPSGTSCRWLRGNHHGHSTVSDGKAEPMEEVAAYETAGYDYFALSEHDTFLNPDQLQSRTAMCVLAAVEVTSCYGQTLMFLGADQALPRKELEPRQIMEQVHTAGGLFVFNHSNWKPIRDYATDGLLDTMIGLKGMEIYCGVIERLPGEAKATDRWDRLLSKGWRVFGHGTDDQHEAGDRFIAWNCVQWPQGEEVNADGIVEALASGRFYASTGVEIESVGVAGGGEQAIVESDADEIHWIGSHGVILKKERGGSGSIAALEVVGGLGGNAASESRPVAYVRAECLGRGSAVAWTQPFWVTE